MPTECVYVAVTLQLLMFARSSSCSLDPAALAAAAAAEEGMQAFNHLLGCW
jgi:hypothetical protein